LIQSTDWFLLVCGGDSGTRYKLLVVSLEGAPLEEISISLNQRQPTTQLACLVVTACNEVRHTSVILYAI